MRITVKYEDGDVHELDVQMVVVQTVVPVKLAANNAYEIVIMNEEYNPNK